MMAMTTSSSIRVKPWRGAKRGTEHGGGSLRGDWRNHAETESHSARLCIGTSEVHANASEMLLNEDDILNITDRPAANKRPAIRGGALAMPSEVHLSVNRMW